MQCLKNIWKLKFSVSIAAARHLEGNIRIGIRVRVLHNLEMNKVI